MTVTGFSVLAAACAALAMCWWWPGPLRRGPLARPPTSSRWAWASRIVQRRRPTSTSKARQVGALCSALASELRAGQPPEVAWEAVLGAWSGPLPGGWVANTDVATVLARWGRVQGWGGLTAVATCWSVADGTGGGLADALDRLGDAMRHEDEVAAEVHSQLASVRATAAVLAILPAVALAMGHALGADPIAVLVGGPVGWACLTLGVLLAGAGWWWLIRQVESVRETLRW